jgi:hypothetical protein
MKTIKFLSVSLFVGMLSTSAFAGTCSELVGEYQLVKVVKDTAQYDDCPDTLVIEVKSQVLVVGREDGVVYSEIQANHTSTANTSRGAMVEKVTTKESYSNCEAESKSTRYGTSFGLPFVSTEYVKLKAGKYDDLSLTSKDINGLSNDGKISCNYQKH